MKELTIEWRHYEKDGATCERCSNTGKTLVQTVQELVYELKSDGVQVTYKI